MTRRYEFVLHGRLDRGAGPALSGFTRTTEGDYVVLRGELDPSSGLPAVLAQFVELGLGLHSFRQLADGQDEAEPAPTS